jgi:hypothetical protein
MQKRGSIVIFWNTFTSNNRDRFLGLENGGDSFPDV